MKTSAILLSLLAAVAAVPMATHTLMAQNIPATWHASNYTQSCSLAGCAYQFTLSKGAVENTSYEYDEPAFSTVCNGTSVQGKLVPCANSTISTNSIPDISNATNATSTTIAVRHMWSQNLTGGPDAGVGTFWILGNLTIQGFPFPTEFDVPQFDSFAVA